MKKISPGYKKELLESVIDNIHVSINIFDKAGNRVFANPHYYFVTGKELNAKISKNFNPDEEPRMKDNILDQKIKEALAIGKVSEIHNYLYQSRLKKTYYYFDMLIGPLKDGAGDIIGAYSIAKDATSRHLAKRKLESLNKNLEKIIEEKTKHLQKLNKQLKKQTEDKDLLLSHVAHEIKTILTIIKGNSDIIKSNDESNNLVSLECHAEISREVERLSGVISDLVFISKADTYAKLFRVELFDLTKVLKDDIKKHSIIAERKKFKISLTTERAKSVLINADKIKLQTAFGNLIENAIKYGKDGGKLEIAVHTKSNEILITFRDDGQGISKENIDYIFEPFFQAKKTNASNMKKGFGLGLAICRKIITAHKGTIKVRSELGKGTEFIIALPKK
jgi:two-component system phosphate regulon sensor histidine kinase PhoR